MPKRKTKTESIEKRPCDVQGCTARADWRPRVRFGWNVWPQAFRICDRCKANVRAILETKWKELAIRYNARYRIDFISLDSIEEEQLLLS